MLIVGMVDNISDYLYIGQDLDHTLVWMINYNFVLALRYVERYIDSFYIFIRLLHDFAYNNPLYYQRVLSLGEEYIKYINVFKEEAFEIKKDLTIDKRHSDYIYRLRQMDTNVDEYKLKAKIMEYADYPSEIIDMYLTINDLGDLKIKIKDVNDEIIFISYNEMKAKINYYLASILIGKPGGVNTFEERRELFRYLLLAGDDDEARRLRNQFIKAYLGKSMSDPFEINFDIETILDLIDQLKKD